VIVARLKYAKLNGTNIDTTHYQYSVQIGHKNFQSSRH